MKYKTFFSGLMGAMLALPFSAALFANDINLYDQPKADAKAISKVDLSTGIIPIFTPKDGQWIKVADPRNGNVGWVKSSDVNKNRQTKVTFTQRIINNGNSGHSYQIIEYGQPQQLSPRQAQNMMQRMQMQQRFAQQSMQRAMHNMMIEMQNVHDFFRHQWAGMPMYNGFPVIMPIVVMQNKDGVKAAPVHATSTKAAADKK